MILRATCKDVLHKIKAEVATNMPQAGAGKPDPAGASSVHVIAAAAALDGVGPMQCLCLFLSGMGEPKQAYEAWLLLLGLFSTRSAQRGVLRAIWYLFTMQQADLCRYWLTCPRSKRC